MAQLIDGKAIASKVRAEVAVEAAALRARGVTPGLAVVLVGDDPASRSYVSSKSKAAQEAGIAVFEKHLTAGASEAELLALVEQLNRDRAVDGILVQLPLPPQIAAQTIIDAIAPHKDVDGLHPLNLGLLYAGRPRVVPCTPAGIMRLLAEAGTAIAGAEAVVVGRSLLVGRPTAALLLNASATVTVCHSQTRDLAAAVRAADILVVAAGRAELVKGDWIKPGATVIDVGINRGPDGKLVGDVEHAAAAARARAITPVPGGVGPMTVAQLLANTVRSAAARNS